VHVTSVFVTHDQEEALEVSDRVVIMNEGRIEQSGTPEEVYDGPATPFVFGFLGDVNLFHGRLHHGRVRIGESELDAPEWIDARDQAGIAYVRTYDVQLHPGPARAGSLAATVRHVRAFGPVIRVELDLVKDGRTIEAHLPRGQFDRAPVTKGQRIYVSPTRVRVFPREA
jgi:sulfate transport system ATP-binding protein